MTVGFGVSFSKNISLDRNLSLSHLKYFEDTKTFKFAYGSDWWLLNHSFIKESLGEKAEDKHNPNIAGEIAAHPFSFLAYTTKRIKRLLGVANTSILFILCAIIGISSPNLRTYILVTAFILFFYALLCSNLVFSTRHIITIFLPLPFVCCWAVGRFLSHTKTRSWIADYFAQDRQSRISSWVPSYPIFLIFILVVLGTSFHKIHKVRTDPENTAYLPPIKSLKQIIKPGMTVASTYPQLLGYVLNTRSVGNMLLLETIDSLISKYSPDLILFDDRRLKYFTKFKLNGKYPPGYKVVVDDPASTFLILQKTN